MILHPLQRFISRTPLGVLLSDDLYKIATILSLVLTTSRCFVLFSILFYCLLFSSCVATMILQKFGSIITFAVIVLSICHAGCHHQFALAQEQAYGGHPNHESQLSSFPGDPLDPTVPSFDVKGDSNGVGVVVGVSIKGGRWRRKEEEEKERERERVCRVLVLAPREYHIQSSFSTTSRIFFCSC